MESLGENLHQFINKYKLPLIFCCFGLILLVYGLITLSAKSDQNDIQFISGDQQSSSSSAVQSAMTQSLVIDIAGAVKKPGVYHLAEDSRVEDAIRAAGGLSDEADKELVAKQFNLAMKLTDGMKLYIPKQGESVASEIVGGTGDTSVGSKQININTADESSLDSLPGIGKVTAAKIVAGRPYTAVDELFSKKIVSQKVFDQIKSQVSTY